MRGKPAFRYSAWILSGVAAVLAPPICLAAATDAARPARFTPLTALPQLTIQGSSPEYPGGSHGAAHLLDGDVKSEYSSASKGTDTFVDIEFKETSTVTAFRHIDRNDPATVASSELIFRDADGKDVATVPVTHVNKPGGVTTLILPAPVTAKGVRWHVTGLGARKFATVGGAEIAFFTSGKPEAVPAGIVIDAVAVPAIARTETGAAQPLTLSIGYPYAEPAEATIRIDGAKPMSVSLEFGSQTLKVSVPAVESERKVKVAVDIGGQEVLQREVSVKRVRKTTIYILPHSHVDIGYTAVQTEIERKQIANIAKGIEMARATQDNPEGSRYKWNVEVLWAVDSFMRQSPEKAQEFIEAVKKGWIGLDGMYANELTGLCRPEELIRLFKFGTRLYKQCGVPIESAMISDVPGYTWGTVSAMAQAGIKYWSIGPNYFDRMGYTIVTWEDKPFWWVGPNGQDKVLCWVPHQGYAMSHILRSNLTEKFILELMSKLEQRGYPYDISYLRWSGHGDNAPPDESIPGFVKAWNERFESPRLVIGTTTEAFKAFEQKYGDKLPKFAGDWTPYWEDGAGSSARETAMNRTSAERLAQAETLWAMLNPGEFPVADFDAAWRNVLLYSEHTWGAHNSVTEPELKFVADQWKIKQAFALDGDRQSADLLGRSIESEKTVARAIDVFNTTGWLRSDLVTIPKGFSADGDRVTDSETRPVQSQRLTTGELAMLARDVPALGSNRYTIVKGAPGGGPVLAKAEGNQLDNGIVSVRLDEKTGAIVELRAKGINGNLADSRSIALNDYLFVAGADAKNAGHPSNVKITVKEKGPLVASLLVESDAPGCNKLSREVRVIGGLDRVEIINIVDKKRAGVKGGKPGDWAHAGTEEKEGVHFGFAFNVPDGVMRMDIPWAVMRPEVDQIPGACKNWFTVGRWADVSNDSHGVTWATLDAPLVEVGEITAILLGSQTKPERWMNRVTPSQTLYSWAMNNHWHTNYRAYQEGPTTFRYALRPHRGYKVDDACRFGTGLSQPLVVAPASEVGKTCPRLEVEPSHVLLSGFKPSDDGKAWIVRLFGASGDASKATLRWTGVSRGRAWISNTSEEPLQETQGAVDVPAWGIVTLRVEQATGN